MPSKPYILRSIEKAPRDEIEKLQLARLKETVKRAYENVPFYRRKLKEAGVRPEDIRSLEDVRKVFEMAHRLHCKGITVYRYGSRSEQVLYTGEGLTTAEDEYSGGCPTGECAF